MTLENLEDCPQMQMRRDWSEDRTTTIKVSVLQLVNSKLSILEILHVDIKDLKASLEFSQSHFKTLQIENKNIKLTVNTVNTGSA